MTNRTVPGLAGVQLTSANYQPMGFGLTDRIFFLGHGNLTLNDPYQVVDIQTAINALNADTSSPLLRAMIEAYYAGSRDMYLVAAAPIVEYVANWADRTVVLDSKSSANLLLADPTWSPPDGITTAEWDTWTFFERYFVRLYFTYLLLQDWDLPQIIVPLDAPAYKADGIVDFIAQLAAHCDDHFNTSGSVCIGILGSQMTNIMVNNTIQTGWTPDVITEVKNLVNESYLSTLGTGGKFVSVFLGEGVYNFKQLPVSYNASPISAIAGMLSHQTLDQGVTWKQIPNMVSFTGPNLSTQDQNDICELGLNPIVRTTLGKRGNFFEVVPSTDNTLALNGSDFWSMTQMRLILRVIEDVRTIGRRYLGSIGYAQAKLDIESYFTNLMNNNLLRSFTLNIGKATSTVDGVTDVMKVDISVTPYFGLRQINFIAFVGPGA